VRETAAAFAIPTMNLLGDIGDAHASAMIGRVGCDHAPIIVLSRRVTAPRQTGGYRGVIGPRADEFAVFGCVGDTGHDST
jgi:hypothetical protein